VPIEQVRAVANILRLAEAVVIDERVAAQVYDRERDFSYSFDRHAATASPDAAPLRLPQARALAALRRVDPGKMRRNFALAMKLGMLRPWLTASLSAAAEMICLSGLRSSGHAG
jgi:hypothetical protein